MPSALASDNSLPYGHPMIHSLYKGFRRNFGSVLALALPIIGSNLAQSSTHLADAVMLGWYGVDALAAGVLGSTAFMIIFIVGSGFAIAAISLAANAEGGGLTWKVRRIVRMSWWITMLFAILMVVPMWNAGALMVAFGQEPHIAALTGEYMRIATWGLFPALTVGVMRSFFLALVRPQIVFWATATGASINALANYALIFGNWGAPELGLRGAAVASVASQSISLGLMLIYLNATSGFRSYSLLKTLWRPDWSEFKSVFQLGWPISATLFAEVGLFSLSAVMMGWIDTATLAAHGIALQIASIVFMVYLGFSNASTVLVGRAVGRRDIEELKSSARKVLILTLIMVCATVLAFVAFPETLVGAFLDRTDDASADVLRIGIVLVYLAAVFQLADALQVTALGLLRGLNDTRVPMVIAAVSYAIVGFPSSYLLGFVFDLKGPGVWAGFIIALGLAAVLLFRRFSIKLKELPI